MIFVFLLTVFAPKADIHPSRAVTLASMEEELVLIEKLEDRFRVLAARLKKDKQGDAKQAVEELKNKISEKLWEAKDFVMGSVVSAVVSAAEDRDVHVNKTSGSLFSINMLHAL